MKIIAPLFIPFVLFANATFITPIEYASRLYKNPRGIGCHKCHGIDGKGLLIAKYTHKNKEKEFHPPAITGMTFQEFYKAMNAEKKGMPRYILTKKEIQALYLYLMKANDK